MSSTPQSSILFLPHTVPGLLEMVPIAKKILQDGAHKPIFLLNNKTAPILSSQLKQMGFQSFQLPEPNLQFSRPAFLRQCLSDFLCRQQAAKVLKQTNAAAVILISDRQLGWETAFVWAANKQGVPSVICPFALSFPQAAATFRLRQPGWKFTYGMFSPVNALVALLRSQWSYVHQGHRLLFAPGFRSLWNAMLGLMPTKPWTLGGGKASLMCVESEQAKQMFISQGVPATKMVVTGKPGLDQIATAINSSNSSSVRESLNIPAGNKILLCSVPQLAEHKLLSWEDHWREIEFLFSTFSKLANVSVVLSLHPKSDPEKYQSLATKYGAKIATQRIYELLPMCDVFVATFSSTVAQAIALHKPTVVVDFYGFDYPLYNNAPGVTVIQDKTALVPLLQHLTSDGDFYASESEKQRMHGRQWALLDGKNTERFVSHLYNLIRA